MITSRRMAVVDANADAVGIPRRVLMESSGHEVAREVQSTAPENGHVVILAGSGNNGGDGFVAARFLDDFEVTVCLVGTSNTISTDIARANWNALAATSVERITYSDSSAISLPEADVIVDGLIGTGISGPIREPMRTAITAMNDHPAPIISIDVPSGLDPDTGIESDVAVAADRVVTFHDIKPGLQEYTGEVRVADIGIPQALERIVERGDLMLLERDDKSHKGENGTVLVVGGGPYPGAPTLAGISILRAGADIARLHVPTTIKDVVQGYHPDLIVNGLPGEYLAPTHCEAILEQARQHDVVLIGPGLGKREQTQSAVKTILSELSGTVVVDADALDIVPEVQTAATVICTPHRGELKRMGGPKNVTPEAVNAFAADIGHVLLLKGNVDIIADGETIRINKTGNAGMTVGGTGDVLAGVTAALATATNPLSAAAIAAFVTGRAGDIVYEQVGNGLLASDVSEALPTALYKRER